MNTLIASIQNRLFKRRQRDEQNRRREARLPIAGEAVVQVVESKDPTLIGLTFRSAVKDVSRGGMRLACKKFIEDSKLEVCINLEGVKEKLWLKTDTRWSSRDSVGDFEIGIQVIDQPVTDAMRWFQIFDSRSVNVAGQSLA